MYLLHIINDISMYNDIKRKIVISSGWNCIHCNYDGSEQQDSKKIKA